eukprot:TRINITY_DN2436_c0_g2_i1.p1 TRINITY_DN2436_c0_g2~~TRINITY_DN2436_c0_g2_i1.p1  ORF type:complete len:641 (-),score=291.82 TRINITY_DN2436_c0_g2_i1:134-2056(-)
MSTKTKRVDSVRTFQVNAEDLEEIDDENVDSTAFKDQPPSQQALLSQFFGLILRSKNKKLNTTTTTTKNKKKDTKTKNKSKDKKKSKDALNLPSSTSLPTPQQSRNDRKKTSTLTKEDREKQIRAAVEAFSRGSDESTGFRDKKGTESTGRKSGKKKTTKETTSKLIRVSSSSALESNQSMIITSGTDLKNGANSLREPNAKNEITEISTTTSTTNSQSSNVKPTLATTSSLVSSKLQIKELAELIAANTNLQLPDFSDNISTENIDLSDLNVNFKDDVTNFEFNDQTVNQLYEQLNEPSLRDILTNALVNSDPTISNEANIENFNAALKQINQMQQEQGQIETSSGNSFSIKGKTVTVISQLGKGATATVWKACINDNIVAMKTISLVGVKDRNALKKVLIAEVEMIKELTHPNVIKYFGSFYLRKEQEMNLIMELLEGGSLTKYIKLKYEQSGNNRAFNEQLCSQVCCQILSGLAFLHANSIIHRDLKPDNCLVDLEGVVKLIDFGTATKVLGIKTARRSNVGTPWYTAPEVINSEEYSYLADIWSLGCSLYEMVLGIAPYHELNAIAALFKMAEGFIETPSGLSTECKEFIETCLTKNKKTRKNAASLLEYNFIKNYTNCTDYELVILVKEQIQNQI